MRIMLAKRQPKALPQLAQEIGQELDRWRRRKDLTQQDLEQIARVSQGQLSRILEGRFTRVGPALRRLCRSAGIDLARRLRSSGGAPMAARLETELKRSWDGSDAHAHALIQLLRVARSLRRE
jgi:transcriptional regulator with XRE-family HTH domain